MYNRESVTGKQLQSQCTDTYKNWISEKNYSLSKFEGRIGGWNRMGWMVDGWMGWWIE